VTSVLIQLAIAIELAAVILGSLVYCVLTIVAARR
jgi:hypothetical protein